ncbi:MAG: CDP-glycerol glycerophosphotransferase family protein [Parachlamydiaceae bacterium]
MTDSIKGVAVNPLGQKQFLDHLAPLASCLNIPYLFHDEAEASQAECLYPHLKTIYLPHEDFNPEYLIAHFDCLFMSDQWNRHVFREKFLPLEKKYRKTIRNVHCPHGFSDKGFYLRGCAFEDICLVYGQNMLDLLDEWGVRRELENPILCGNFRYAFYQKHKEFYDSLMNESIFGQLPKHRPTLLYAPTCLDLEESTSFFVAAPILLKNLPDDYNMIVKPHPRLEQDDPAAYYHILSLYEGQENILFLRDMPLIYPLLNEIDIYIGDMSSIGYDFLAFNRPLFLLNQQKRDPAWDRGLFLFRCGTSVSPDDYSRLYQIIDHALPFDEKHFSSIRQETYQYTFCNQCSLNDFNEKIYRLISHEK